MNITIIANGLFPEKPWVDDLLCQADRVVCCDGAIEKYLGWHSRQTILTKHPVDVVGDGDSLDPALLDVAQRQGVAVHFHHVTEQDDNDLTKATHFAIEQATEHEVVQVYIVGATGLREDHTMGNISLLAWYMEQYPDVGFHMLSDYGVFTPVWKHGVFASHAGQQVSIFSLTPEEPVTVAGLRWPITERKLHWWWEGTLNESLGEQFEVWGGRLIVYQLATA